MSEDTTKKTHWLQNPNKNYLGHWDLPDGNDMILTIESAGWEEVTNPIINTTEAKRVVRFKEDVKPFICNEVNASNILKSTGTKFMEDSVGCKIQLYVGIHVDNRSKQDIDCIRIRLEAPVITKPKLTPEHPKWDDAKVAVQGDGATIDSIRAHWDITDEHYKLLAE